MRVFMIGEQVSRDEWLPPLRAALPEAEWTDDPQAADVVVVTPTSTTRDYGIFTNARLVHAVWAGVRPLASNPTLTQPLARMVDPGLTQGMVEYCIGWLLRLHLGMDRYAQDGEWRNGQTPPLSRNRRVTVLGAGALGGAVARAAAALGFDVACFSASGRAVDDLPVFDGTQLHDALARTDIAICLLPDTAQTRGMLNADTLAALPQGAAIINAGRGWLIDDDALLAALRSGAVSAAVLDVFQTEPLPPEHPYWALPNVHVTPHIASVTRPETAAPVLADNIRRAMEGRPVLNLVDRAKGY